VRTTLFPERVPDRRDRLTGFAGVSWSIAPGVALHVRQGVYRDDWGVRALVPEAMLAVELGARGLATARYRYYRQWAADFYDARYDDLQPRLSGDVRLGPIDEHGGGIAARWSFRAAPGEPGALALDASYDVAATDYVDYATRRIWGHVVGVGLAWTR
jgi:hypothetical protein